MKTLISIGTWLIQKAFDADDWLQCNSVVAVPALQSHPPLQLHPPLQSSLLHSQDVLLKAIFQSQQETSCIIFQVWRIMNQLLLI